MKKHASRIIIGILCIMLMISILYSLGQGASIDEAVLSYDELQERIAEKEDELNVVLSELEDNKKYYDELQELAKEHDYLIDTIVDYEVEVSTLEDEIEEKQEELDKINGEIVKVKDNPIKINPGVFYFGDDIDTGRYKLKPQKGHNGNVFFRGDDSFGETFGPGRYSIEEYTFYAGDGEKIEATIPILLYPVE